MTAKALKKNGKLVEFDPHDRQKERGCFLLLQQNEALLLMIDETGAEHHDILLGSLPTELQNLVVVGGGRYGRNYIKTYSHTPRWQLTWSSLRYGNIEDQALQKQIAAIITGGEEEQVLD